MRRSVCSGAAGGSWYIPITVTDTSSATCGFSVVGKKPPIQAFGCGPIDATVREPQLPAPVPGTLAALRVKVTAPKTATAPS